MFYNQNLDVLYVQVCAPHLEASFIFLKSQGLVLGLLALMPLQHGTETRCNERPKTTLFAAFNRSQHPEVMIMFCAVAVEWSCVLGG